MFKGTEQDSGLRTTFFHVGCCRIVVAGSLLQSAVVTNSAARFNFESAFGLSNAMALAVSDHYPVEVTLK